MARIDHYEFGQIVVDGRQETKDLIILPDRVVRNWWRHDSHALVLDDLAEVLDELPAQLIVGTGADGRMRPDPTTLRQLQERGVTVETFPTGQAVRASVSLTRHAPPPPSISPANPRNWSRRPRFVKPSPASVRTTDRPAQTVQRAGGSGGMPSARAVRWSAPVNAAINERIPVGGLSAYLGRRRSGTTCAKGRPHSGYRHLADKDEGAGSSPARPTTSGLTCGNARPVFRFHAGHFHKSPHSGLGTHPYLSG
jgi:hypothetical protein